MTVTRFAPSPTGYLHVGNLRTALMNWLLARKAGGRFILRLDDTDVERSRTEFADAIRADLAWLDLDWDDEVRQSDRSARYANAAEHLRGAGRLYECFETPEELEVMRRAQSEAGRPPVYDRAALTLSSSERDRLRSERPSHWRFRLDRARVRWEDGILGEVSVDAASLSDPVLIRGDGQVLYTLASVVDDVDLAISDVVRGADHVTNTAVQIQIIAALDGAAPRFAHHSLLTGPQGEALSKRLGALALRDLRAHGVEPMALVSLMARLGSSDPVELRATHDAAVKDFEIGRFGAAPTRFDAAALEALSTEYLRTRELDEVADELRVLGLPGELAKPFWETVRTSVTKRSDLADWWRICREGAEPEIAEEDIDFVRDALARLPQKPWTESTWGEWTDQVKAVSGRRGRALFLPLRKTLTGRDHGPSMSDLMPLLRAPKVSEQETTAQRGD